MKGFYRHTNALVEIERHTILKVSSTLTRLGAFIKVLQMNLIQLFDFVIEQHYEQDLPSAYLSLYLIRQVIEDEASNKVSLVELIKHINSLQDAQIILSCIA